MRAFLSRARYRVALRSAVHGSLIPVADWFFESQTHQLGISLEALVALHQMTEVWVIDTIPIILGLYGYLLGLAKERLEEKVERLLESEAHVRSILDTAADGIVTLSADGTIQTVNQAFTTIFGYTENEAVGQSLNNMLASQMDFEPACALFQDLVRGGDAELAQTLTLTGKRKTGEHFQFELRARALVKADGQRSITCVLQDVAERTKLEIHLQQSQKLEAIGQLAAGIAHEINTPIQYVRDNLDALQGSFADLTQIVAAYQATHRYVPESISHELKELERSSELEFILADTPSAIVQAIQGTERVTHIVRAMKDFAHISRNQLTLANINQMLSSALTISHNEYKYIADVRTDFAELPLVECYASELSQVFLNLIVNAAHAIAESSRGRGTMHIATKRLAEEVEITVGDNGCGISESIRNRIFDPFFTTKEVGKGTGQGLSIAHQVIAKHKGTITFQSTPGMGTTFYIRIPIIATDATADQTQREAVIASAHEV